MGIFHVLVREVLDRDGEGRGEEHELAIVGVVAYDFLNGAGEFLRQQLVGFIHDHHAAFAQIRNFLTSQVCYPARGADHDVDRVAQAEDIVSKVRSARRCHDIDVQMLAERLANLRCLQGELSSGDQDDALNFIFLGIDPLEARDDKSGGLARSILCAGQNVPPCKGDRNTLLLDGGGFVETGFEDTH